MMTGEQKLATAIIIQAMEDMARPTQIGSNECVKRLKKEAKNFLFGGGSFVSYRNRICDIAGLNEQWVQSLAKKFEQGASAGNITKSSYKFFYTGRKHAQ